MGKPQEMALQISVFSEGADFVGQKWIQRFLQRHSDIRSKIGRKIDAL
jgi:hypothetical protein